MKVKSHQDNSALKAAADCAQRLGAFLQRPMVLILLIWGLLFLLLGVTFVYAQDAA